MLPERKIQYGILLLESQSCISQSSMRQIDTDFFISKDNKKQIFYPRSRIRTSVLWEKTRRRNKTRSIDVHKPIEKKGEHYLQAFIMTDSASKYSIL